MATAQIPSIFSSAQVGGIEWPIASTWGKIHNSFQEGQNDNTVDGAYVDDDGALTFDIDPSSLPADDPSAAERLDA